MRRRTDPGSPPDFERLVAGLFRLRRLGYGTALAFTAIGAIGLRDPIWAISVVLALAGFLAGTGFRDSRRRLISALITDHLAALVLWWMIGPGTGMDLVPIMIISVSAFALPFRTAAFAVILGEIAIAARVPLHLIGSESVLPMYWTAGQTPVGEIITTTAALATLGLIVAALFSSIGRTLERSRTHLANSAARYRTLVEASPDGIMIHQRGALKYLNEAAATLLGYAQPSIALNTPYLDHVSEHDKQQEIDRMHQVATGETAELARVGLIRTDGSEVIAEAVCFPTELEGHPAVQMIVRDATARHALRDTEMLFDTAFETSVAGMAIIDINGKYLKVNRALRELLGRPADALLSTNWQALTDPEAIEEVETRMAAAIEGSGEDSFSLTTRYLTVDGSTIVALATFTLIKDSANNASRFLCQVTDITDSMAAQEVLRSSEQRYRNLFERIPVALYRSAPGGEILAANPALLEMVGFDSIDDLTALEAHDVYVDQSERSRWIDRIERDGAVMDFEEQLRRKDGTVFWGQDSARTVRATDGTVLYYEGAIINIDARKRAQQAQQRLTRIIEATPDIVVVLDPAGWITYANAAARAFFSIEEIQEPPYLHVSQALDRDTMRLLIEEIIPRLRDGQAWTGDMDLQAPDGSIMPVSVVGLTHHGADGRVARFSAVLRDVSEQVETTKQLQDLVRTKDEFVASVSHELRTPLTAVVGLAQELRDHRENFEEEELIELINLIADQGTEVSAIVQDLLVAARADIGSITINPVRFRVADEVEAAIRTIPAESVERLELDVDSVDAWADPGRFRQIVRNLVTNALRYGGPNVRVRAHNGANQAVVDVTDDGRGIPAADRARIFDPYFRAHDDPTQPASVGLGLTVSRQLAELMGGELDYSYENGLSTFSVRLPTGQDD
ncbi:MAG: PAS domain S-box protein [Acidimicrobiia bacterium]|nr:PAS domain S-box protein [Acidimicrobiia bacterium]